MKLYIFSLVFLAVSGRSRTDRYDPIDDERTGSFTHNTVPEALTVRTFNVSNVQNFTAKNTKLGN